ncbi:hypothetical protein G3T20_00635 [Bordetella hinzii]|nr:hypothetical protein G3T20_00635 [Bordetella hinzii]
MFARIDEIDMDDEGSWKGRIFLTLDMDWAADFVLADAIDLLTGVPATWFVTHSTPLLDRLRAEPGAELGIHPNFNPLLFTASAAGDVNQVLDGLQRLVPEAVSVRSHSLVHGTGILAECERRGFRYDCNLLIPWSTGMALRPWRHWEPGMLRVPHCWEDDVACMYGWPFDAGNDYWYRPDGLNVIDLHPIHLYLNTESLARYEQSRPVHRDPALLASWRHQGHGARSFLMALLEKYR